MGKLTIVNKIAGTVNGAQINSSAQQTIPIQQGTDLTLFVDATWRSAASAITIDRVVVLVNTGAEDALYRVLIDTGLYSIANLPAGAAVVVYISDNAQYLGDGSAINQKSVDVYSANGTTIRVGNFF